MLFVDKLVEVVKDRIDHIKKKHLAYVFVSDRVDPAKLSIDYTKISVNKPARFFYIYYSREAISAYRKILNEVSVYERDREFVTEALHLLEQYIEGWSYGREVTKENMMILTRMINQTSGVLNSISNTFDRQTKEFQTYNDDPTEMVDRFTLSFYKVSKEVPYKSIYQYFFKKDGRLPIQTLREQFDSRTQDLDILINALENLYQGYEHTGKGDLFESHKLRQRQLMNSIQSMADLIEQDLILMEKIIELEKLVINVKIYPD